MKSIKIDAKEIHYKILNERIIEEMENGYKEIILENVCGQRYIGAGLRGNDLKIIINGTPGNDLAAFMDGPEIIVNGNAQDGTGNTMNSGKIIIHGNAGDITGHSMRGGKIFVKGDVGYRVGIHMKAYKNLFPVIVVGGRARDFLGEYMAGGLIIVLSLLSEEIGDFIAPGMHGGKIFIRGEIEKFKIAKEVKIENASQKDLDFILPYIKEFSEYFHYPIKEILKEKFYKLESLTTRPYGKIYAY